MGSDARLPSLKLHNTQNKQVVVCLFTLLQLLECKDYWKWKSLMQKIRMTRRQSRASRLKLQCWLVGDNHNLTWKHINTSIKMSILFWYVIICFWRVEADLGFYNLADASKQKLPCFRFVLMCTLACTDGEFSKSLPKYTQTHTPLRTKVHL